MQNEAHEHLKVQLKARRLISSSQTLMMTKSSASRLLTAYKGAPFKKML